MAGAVAAVDEEVEGWVVVMISSLAAGAGAIGATAAGVDGADGCGRPASSVGAGAGAGGSVRCATSLSSLPDLKFLRLKPGPERPGALIWIQDRWSHPFRASMGILWPSISKEFDV